MQNADGVNVDLYIPRKCSWTNKILAANDAAAVQINVAHIDPDTGKFVKGSYTTFGLCGYLRSQSESDSGLTQLIQGMPTGTTE